MALSSYCHVGSVMGDCLVIATRVGKGILSEPGTAQIGSVFMCAGQLCDGAWNPHFYSMLVYLIPPLFKLVKKTSEHDLFCLWSLNTRRILMHSFFYLWCSDVSDQSHGWRCSTFGDWVSWYRTAEGSWEFNQKPSTSHRGIEVKCSFWCVLSWSYLCGI